MSKVWTKYVARPTAMCESCFQKARPILYICNCGFHICETCRQARDANVAGWRHVDLNQHPFGCANVAPNDQNTEDAPQSEKKARGPNKPYAKSKPSKSSKASKANVSTTFSRVHTRRGREESEDIIESTETQGIMQMKRSCQLVPWTAEDDVEFRMMHADMKIAWRRNNAHKLSVKDRLVFHQQFSRPFVGVGTLDVKKVMAPNEYPYNALGFKFNTETRKWFDVEPNVLSLEHTVDPRDIGSEEVELVSEDDCYLFALIPDAKAGYRYARFGDNTQNLLIYRELPSTTPPANAPEGARYVNRQLVLILEMAPGKWREDMNEEVHDGAMLPPGCLRNTPTRIFNHGLEDGCSHFVDSAVRDAMLRISGVQINDNEVFVIHTRDDKLPVPGVKFKFACPTITDLTPRSLRRGLCHSFQQRIDMLVEHATMDRVLKKEQPNEEMGGDTTEEEDVPDDEESLSPKSVPTSIQVRTAFNMR